jgi:putative membrane protein
LKILWNTIFLAVLIWSGILPHDTLTWFLEVLPAIIGFGVIIATYKKFPLTPLVYGLILLHMIILMVGGHYSYAEVPLFNEIKDFFGSTRNNYDKLGHFAQGFIPAIIMREFLIRKSIFNSPKWRSFFTICFCLAFSAFYELTEWWAAISLGDGAEDFLGTQGYVWDTQSDMWYALVGSVLSLLLLSKFHDKQLSKIMEEK